jgi:hypothetical protein
MPHPAFRRFEGAIATAKSVHEFRVDIFELVFEWAIAVASPCRSATGESLHLSRCRDAQQGDDFPLDRAPGFRCPKAALARQRAPTHLQRNCTVVYASIRAWPLPRQRGDRRQPCVQAPNYLRSARSRDPQLLPRSCALAHAVGPLQVGLVARREGDERDIRGTSGSCPLWKGGLKNSPPGNYPLLWKGISAARGSEKRSLGNCPD